MSRVLRIALFSFPHRKPLTLKQVEEKLTMLVLAFPSKGGGIVKAVQNSEYPKFYVLENACLERFPGDNLFDGGGALVVFDSVTGNVVFVRTSFNSHVTDDTFWFRKFRRIEKGEWRWDCCIVDSKVFKENIR